MFKHLKDNNMGYWAHWWRATTMGVALIIHGWFPDTLEYYASEKMRDDME